MYEIWVLKVLYSMKHIPHGGEALVSHIIMCKVLTPNKLDFYTSMSWTGGTTWPAKIIISQSAKVQSPIHVFLYFFVQIYIGGGGKKEKKKGM